MTIQEFAVGGKFVQPHFHHGDTETRRKAFWVCRFADQSTIGAPPVCWCSIAQASELFKICW